MMLIGMIALPALAVMLPADALRHHFDKSRSSEADWRNQHPVIRWGLRIAKNMLGVLLAVAGLAMLILPGQGVLTLLAAFVLLDLPGKRNAERRLLNSPRLLRPINKLRARFDKPPLLPPDPAPKIL